MAATTHQRQPQHPHHPSLSALSETSSASSHVYSFPSFPSHPSYAADQPPPPPPPLTLPVVPSVSNARNTKGLVLGGRAVSVPVARPIRRKPLSSTASPIATRYSSGEYLASVVKNLPRPEQRYDRSFSVDSPIVYEFPLPQVAPMSRPHRWDKE